MRKKIKQLFDKAKVDAIILRTFPGNPEPAFFYFSRLPFGFLTNNILLLNPDRKPLLLRSVLDPEVKSKKLRARTVRRREQMKSLLRKELKGKRIGINKLLYPLNSFKNLKKAIPRKRFVDVSQQLRDIMAIKEPWEIARIAKAAKITEGVLRQVPRIFKKGITEKQLAFELEFLLREKQREELAFPPVIANARNSIFPHHVPSDRKIKKGILLIDCGARYKGYCADITRVFSVGKPSKKEQNVYEAVFEAKKLGESLSIEGALASDVFKKVSAFLKKEIGHKLPHGLGHGLGMLPHDSPSGFLSESKDVLVKGMVLTVEPAVYLKRFGIRIEDDIVVGKKGCKKLSNAPKELIKL